MKFLITCDNCDYQFLTTGESRQTVQCQCPHCGGLMKMKLPEAADVPAEEPESVEDDEPQMETDTSQDEPRRRTGCGIMVGIFLGLFILVLVAMIAYSLTRTERTQPIEDPFAHAVEDTASYEDEWADEPEAAPDTVERHVEERVVEPVDTAPEPAVHHMPVETSGPQEHNKKLDIPVPTPVTVEPVKPIAPVAPTTPQHNE